MSRMGMSPADLALLGIHHDIFSSEAELLASGAPQKAEAELRARDLVYDGVLPPTKGEVPDDWEPVELPLFRSTQYGDDIDRPIRKSNGQWTYFGNDMAYHAEKARRSSALVNIWGADHAGTVKRIQAAVAARHKLGQSAVLQHQIALAQRMAPPYNRVQSFLALNGIQNRALQPGEQLKLIVVG